MMKKLKGEEKKEEETRECDARGEKAERQQITWQGGGTKRNIEG